MVQCFFTSQRTGTWAVTALQLVVSGVFWSILGSVRRAPSLEYPDSLLIVCRALCSCADSFFVLSIRLVCSSTQHVQFDYSPRVCSVHRLLKITWSWIRPERRRTEVLWVSSLIKYFKCLFRISLEKFATWQTREDDDKALYVMNSADTDNCVQRMILRSNKSPRAPLWAFRQHLLVEYVTAISQAVLKWLKAWLYTFQRRLPCA